MLINLFIVVCTVSRAASFNGSQRFMHQTKLKKGRFYGGTLKNCVTNNRVLGSHGRFQQRTEH